jgi:hypothetical protein
MASKDGPTASAVAYNYADTAADAPQVAGASRPGAKAQKCFGDCVADPVSADDVAAWVGSMKARDVGAVISLLNEDEIRQTYAAPGVEAAMRAAFGDANYANFSFKGPGAWSGCPDVGCPPVARELGARQQVQLCFHYSPPNPPTHHRPPPPGAAPPASILAAVDAHVAAGRKPVIHCWGGGGRTGLVQAAWLARARGLGAAEAAAKVTEYAQQQGVPRRVDVAALEAFLADAKK